MRNADIHIAISDQFYNNTVIARPTHVYLCFFGVDSDIWVLNADYAYQIMFWPT